MKEELYTLIERLDDKQTIIAKHFLENLIASKTAKGTSGKSLLKFAGMISKEELQLMSAAIEEGCERIDTNEW